jgi:hypothetical protein
VYEGLLEQNPDAGPEQRAELRMQAVAAMPVRSGTRLKLLVEVGVNAERASYKRALTDSNAPTRQGGVA